MKGNKKVKGTVAQPKRRMWLRVTTTLITFLALLLFFSSIWGIKNIANLDLNQILYFVTGPTDGTDSNLVLQYSIEALLPVILLTVLFVVVFYVLGTKTFKFKKDNKVTKIICKIFPIPRTKLIAFILSIVLFAGSATYSFIYFDVKNFVKNITEDSSFIADNYVDPKTANITFPEQKQNLVYIYMESTETTYFSPENGGLFNVMPEIENLALNNINFSSGEGLGGAKQYASTDWTIAGLTAQTAGVPLKSNLKRNKYGKDIKEFLPGVYSLGQVLESQGYRNSLLIGSDKAFANRDKYFSQHGNYTIYDLNDALDAGVVQQENDFWGFEDKILFELAKKQLAEVASDTSTPFNFTVLTVDTHYPYGWVCEDCPQVVEPEDPNDAESVKYANYKNAMACSSKKVADFVEWIKAQPFYENTTIIISGDHLSMSKLIDEEADENEYNRTTTNIFINALATPSSTKNRDFGTFDMYPTTLAAIGCTIEGERLGLGTNLFSNKPTIAETIGYEAFNTELEKQSTFYNIHILGGIQKLEK